MLTKMIINDSDFEIIELLSEKETLNITNIRDKTKKSRVSVYHSLKKLESLGLIDKRGSEVKLQKNPLVTALSNLMTEGLSRDYLTGRKLSILTELLDETDISNLSEKAGISASSARRYINELSVLLIENHGRYRVNDRHGTLTGFLKLMKSQSEFLSGALTVRKKHYEKLVKAKKAKIIPGGVLTGFSRFFGFGVEYHTIYEYYFLPERELLIEEILVHALCCAEDANMLSMCIIFYLKNKGKIDIFKVEEISKKFDVINLWTDVTAYLENTRIKNKSMFLEKSEFLKKADVYGITPEPKYPEKNLFTIFGELSVYVKNEIKIYMIGGGALITYGIKETTKDLDLVVEDNENFEALKNALFDINFHEVADVTPAYKNFCTSTIMERKNSPRIDIFIKKVCGGIALTKSMKERASLKIRYNNIVINILSPEDIFLFKAFSSREGDLIDCERIILKTKINWNIILAEYIKQQKTNEGFFGLVILDHLETLQKRSNMKIPVIKKLSRVCLENAISHRAKTPKTIREIKNEIDFAEYEIRNAVERLVRQGKLKKIPGKDKSFLIVKSNN